MKKLLLYSALALSMAFSSCSRDDNTDPQTPQEDGTVTVTVTLPEEKLADAGSRALPQAYPGHKLRCILIVQENGTVTDRQEKLADEAQDGSFFFTINPEGEDFKCSFWADYIKEDATATDGRYPDLYYQTESLPVVSYKMTGNELFNNEACDAFSLSLLNGVTAGTMTRPLAKLGFKDERIATVAAAGNVSVSNYPIYNGFDIVNGTVSDTPVPVSYSGPVADAAGGVWFYNYLFVGNKNALPGNFTMSVGENTHEMSTAKVTLTPNRPITASLNWERANGIITVDVSLDDPDTPNVGDYYYSDGTWSSRLQTGKTVIGVVFATSETEAVSDSPANYSDVTFADGKVRAWVVGLKEISPTPRFSQNASGSGVGVGTINGVETAETDIKGYANSKAWRTNTGITYSALDKVGSYELVAPSRTSGWYIGAIGQMDVLRTVYNAENSVVKAALQALADESKADLLVTESAYWSSTALEGESGNSVRTIMFDPSEAAYLGSHNGSSGRPVRPILTF